MERGEEEGGQCDDDDRQPENEFASENVRYSFLTEFYS